MPVRKDEALKLLSESVESVGDALRGHSKFLFDLLEEDDWSFVIKSHALIEAVVTQLITEHAADPRFRAVFERLPIADEETGKIAIAKSLNLLTAPQRRFIRFYSSLRNNLVHKVANVDFKFSEHIAKLDPSQRKSWRDSIVWFAESDELRAVWGNRSIETPKTALWMAVFMLVSLSEATTIEAKTMKKIEELSRKTSEELLCSPETD